LAVWQLAVSNKNLSMSCFANDYQKGIFHFYKKKYGKKNNSHLQQVCQLPIAQLPTDYIFAA